jgi:adenylylsulfate kinase
MKHKDVYVSLSLDHIALSEAQAMVCADYQLRPRPELHITLGFLGEVEDELLAALSRELSKLSQEAVQNLTLKGLGGVYQKITDGKTELLAITDETSNEELRLCSRVLWWVVEANEALLRCQTIVKASLEKLNIPAELHGPYSPHITIGSFSSTTESNPKLWDVYDIEKTKTLSRGYPTKINAERLHITKTELHPQSLFLITEFCQRRGAVVWLTGWPASGKSTLARILRRQLSARNQESIILDSDELRYSVFPKLGYTEEERALFYSYLSSMAELLARQGLVVLVAATANKRSYREEARKKSATFIEVYINAPKEESTARDPKKLYQEGKIDFQYEPPLSPEVMLSSATEERGLQHILELIMHSE